MNVTDYRTTTAMLADHPDVRVTAVRFRVRRLVQGEDAATAELGADLSALVEQWHRLQAREARLHSEAERRDNRHTSVHRGSLRAARRREAASCPVPLFATA